jgi:eukaryotic-like serine/threonine-protein kinase
MAKSISLWEVSLDGGNAHALLPNWNNPPYELPGSWTPGGKYFIFDSNQKGKVETWARREKDDLFHKVNWDPIQLTTGPMDIYAAVSSRDGKKLFALGDLRSAQLIRVDAKSHQRTPYLAGISAWWVNFSQDRKWVAYSTLPGDTIWRCKTDGSGRTQLTFPPLSATEMRWSPDARRIAFAATHQSWNGWRVYIVSADGGTPEPLTAEGENAEMPNWSPDGSRLLFTSDPQGAHMDLRTINLQTKEISIIPGSEGIGFGRWSPDGKLLAAEDFKNNRTVLFDFGSGKWSELVKPRGWGLYWSRDSKFVYFFSSEKGEDSIDRVRIADHKLERVLSLKNIAMAADTITNIYSEFALAADDSIVLPLDATKSDVYALDVTWP